MGFIGKVFSGIGHALGKVGSFIGHGIGSIAKGVGKFLQSPIGKLVTQVGLAFLTGGASTMFSGLLGGGLSSMLGGGLSSMLGGGGISGLLSGGLGNLLGGSGLGNLVSGFASKFLSNPSSLLSGSGLSSVLGFLGNAQNSSGLLDMAKSIFGAQSSTPAVDGAAAGAQINMQQMTAFMQAQQLMAA